MLFALLFTIVVLALIYAVVWSYKRSLYWKDKPIPYIASHPLLGHFGSACFLKENVKDPIWRLYHHAQAKSHALVGVNIFHKPAIMVRDPELIKKVLIKDFNFFSDRHTGADPKVDPIGGNNLFQMKNPSWKIIRSKLSPVFTSGKMKQMFYMVEKVAGDMKEKVAFEQSGVLEVRTLFSRFTVDVISLVAFGTEANCLKDPDTSEFLQNAKKSLMSSVWSKICFNAVFFLPEMFKIFRMTTFDPGFGSFLRELFKEVTANRLETKSVRNDLIDALIAVKKDDNGLFTEDVLVAQAVVFFVAGFETSSSTMAFIFHHLATHPDVQAKLREEIKDALNQNDNKLSYENVMNEMPYLSAVINETLRMYPPLPFLDRECVSPYSLEPYSDFKVPKGMPVIIPIHPIQNDPEYFSNPEKFDPSRFEGSPPSEYTFMPFGLGPHNCIGERFAWMQIKLGLINILRSFKVSLAEGSPRQMVLDETCILFRPKHPVNISFTKDELV